MEYLSYSLIALSIFFPVLHVFIATFSSDKKHRQMLAPIRTGISVLVPCYNEQRIIQTCIFGMNRLDYPNYEVIFINDGSTDSTLEVLNELLDLVPTVRPVAGVLNHQHVRNVYQSLKYKNMIVIDKVNGGKADSLNAGIEYASQPIVVTLDADSILESDALKIVNDTFLDENVVAGGGTVRILQGYNGHTTSFKLKHIVRLQTLEYMKGFLILKASLAKLNALSIISGAFGVFRTDVLLEVGGYRNTIGEDIDITMRVQTYVMKHPEKKVVFMPHAICYTECPENWRDLTKQRIRWQKAFVDCVIKYKRLILTKLFHPITIFFLIDAFLTGTVGTFLTVGSAITLLFLPPPGNWRLLVMIFVIVSSVVNAGWSITATLLSRKFGVRYSGMDYVRIGMTILLELVGYRIYLMYLLIAGTILFFFNKHSWNKVERTGRVYDITA